MTPQIETPKKSNTYLITEEQLQHFEHIIARGQFKSFGDGMPFLEFYQIIRTNIVPQNEHPKMEKNDK